MRSFPSFISLMAAVILLCQLSIFAQPTRLVLSEGKTPLYAILFDKVEANSREAAAELHRQLQAITGVDFPMVETLNDHQGAFISVGNSTQAAALRQEKSDGKPMVRIDVRDGNLYLYGTPSHYDAVMAFLEDDVHCRFFTPEITRYPKCGQSFAVDVTPRTETPSFARRLILTDYGLVLKSDWYRHNRVKPWEHFDHPRDWFCHTYSKILPWTDFAKTPELFAVVNGKPSQTSLCPTHPENIRRAKILMRKAMEDNPDKMLFSIAENDGDYPYCQCERCLECIHKYGDAPIAAHLHLVNEVAKSVADKAPAQRVEFIVYSTAFHKPPVGLAIEPNVSMWYCGTLQSEERSAEFIQWHKLVKNVSIWEYGVDFYDYFHIISKFPLIVDDLKKFSELGVEGIMCHEPTGVRAGDLQRLRAWVFAKLLWNASLDADELAREYCDGVYGEAADDLFEYYKLVNAPGKQSKTVEEFYDRAELLAKADKCFQRALAKTPLDSLARREIETDYLPVLVSRANDLFEYYPKHQDTFPAEEYSNLVAYITRIVKEYAIPNRSETASMTGYLKERQMLVDMLNSESPSIEIRAVEGRIYGYPQTTDSLAEGEGLVTRQQCDGNWIVQWVLPANLMKLGARYQLEAEFRIEKPSNSDYALGSGIYDNVNRKEILFAKVPGEKLSDKEYRFIKLGEPFVISHRGEVYVYFEAPPTSDIGSFFVNRIRITEVQ